MRETQAQRVLRHLQDGQTLTAAEAVREYGIMQLPARIFHLRSAGHAIQTEWKCATNRYGEPVHFAEYSLEA